MKEIIKSYKISLFHLGMMLLLLFSACSGGDELSEREITVGLLTNNTEKYWVLDKSNIDGQPITPSECDSSYVLIMNADFTWEEMYLKLKCNPPGSGKWDLNEQNDVISIEFINPGSGAKEERQFEIEELSDKYLAYQYAENNRLKFVRLKEEE